MSTETAPTIARSPRLWLLRGRRALMFYIDSAAWDRTVKISQETKNLEGSTVLTKAPDAAAYTNDIVTAAHALLESMGVDINGADFAPIDVTLTEGGA